MNGIVIYPVPKKVKYYDCAIDFDESEVNVKFNEKMRKEEYIIMVDKDGVCIKCRDDEALFRARTTLKQILSQTGKQIPYLKIEDWPDFEDRGLMIDISRCRVQTLDTLKRIADIASELKFNQMQLYIEGFSFAYEDYPQVWEGITPLTGEEISELDKYCKERFVDLVPNQNSYGHMMPWLEREEFKHLAMCPDGFYFELFGHMKTGWSLDLQDEKALEFLFGLYDDLLKFFSSDKFNVCCDETLDLGQGKSKEACEKYGKGHVYYEGLMKIYENVKSRGLKMMFWGDIILNHPEYAKKLPKDVIALNWGYDANDVSEESCKCFQQAGVPYYVCPGTSAWNSIWGMTDKMMSNIRTSAYNGLKYGAVGYLLTDWGDLWHLHHLPVSYPGYCYGAAMAWNACEEQEKYLAEYMNMFIFKDKNNVMGQLLIDMGRYINEEMIDRLPKYGRTHLAHILCGSLEEKDTAAEVTKDNLIKVYSYIEEKLTRLQKASMECDDADLIKLEVEAGAMILKFACLLGLYKIDGYDVSKETYLKVLKEIQDKTIEMHKRAWLARNKPSRMHEGVEALAKIK